MKIQKLSQTQKKYQPCIIGLAVAIDIAILYLADISAFGFYFWTDFYKTGNFSDYQQISVLVILFKVFSLYVYRLYTKPVHRSRFMTAISIVKAMTFSTLMMVVTAYFFRADSIPRLVVLYSWIFSMILIFAWRMINYRICRLFLGDKFFKYHLLVLGTDILAEKTAVSRLNNAALNYELVGFIDLPNQQKRSKSALVTSRILGAIEDIPEILRRHRVDEVLVTHPHIGFTSLVQIFSAVKDKKGINFCTVPEIYDRLITEDSTSEIQLSLISALPFRQDSVWYPFAKRLTDVVLSALLLAALAPVFLLIMVLIRLTSPGPVFYVTKRVGLGGKEFVMYKFRSMYDWSAHRRIELWANPDDPRVTPVGKVLRRFRLDELPQLINVFKNDMSLIGPRPETKHYVTQLLKNIPLYSERLSVKPGITGWAQVNYRYAASIEETREKLLFDIYYVQNQCFSLDVLIMMKTLPTVVTGKGAV